MKKMPAKKYAFLAAISAVLTSLSQITEGWFLAAFSLVPIYICLLRINVRHVVICLWVFLVTYHGILCAFLVTLYDYLALPRLMSVLICIAAVIVLSCFLSLVMFISIYPAVKLSTKSAVLKVTVFAACFSFGQLLTEIIPVISFPWAKLENAFAYQPVMLQSAALLGGNFTAFLILMFNGLAACLVISLTQENAKLTLKYSAALSLLFSATLCGGALYMVTREAGDSINVTAVQGSEEGMLKAVQSSDDAAKEYSMLINGLSDIQHNVILLPETAISTVLSDEHISLLTGSAKNNSAIVTGCIYKDENGYRYNALVALNGSGTRHLKQVLVPIGEYMPFFRLKGFASLTPSRIGGSLIIDGRKYAAVICIESIYSSLLSRQIDSGCEMILLSTNDSWFKDSYARELHFRHCIVRAVEYDRYLMRSGNCGISALIDRSGNIAAAEFGKESSSVTAQAQLLGTKTPYSVFGNIFQLPAALYVSGYYLLALMRKITRSKA